MSVLGTLVREWKRESSQKLVKIWQLWKKIMRKLALIPLRAREMKRVESTKYHVDHVHCIMRTFHVV